MRIRSLLIGSIAAVGVSAGAYATDLSVMAFGSTAIVVTDDLALYEFGPVFGDKWLNDVIIAADMTGLELYPDGDGVFDEGFDGAAPSDLLDFEIVRMDSYMIQKAEPSDWGDQIFYDELMNAPDVSGGFKIPAKIDVADIRYPGLTWSVTEPGIGVIPAIAGTCRVADAVHDCGLSVGGANG